MSTERDAYTYQVRCDVCETTIHFVRPENAPGLHEVTLCKRCERAEVEMLAEMDEA